MATKDWKISVKSKLRPEWENKKNHNILSIFNKIMTNDWYLDVKKFNGEKIIKQKKFKTKSAALKYAKSYMRKH